MRGRFYFDFRDLAIFMGLEIGQCDGRVATIARAQQANGLGQPEGVEAGMRRVTQVTSCVDFPAERESCPANGV